MNVKNPMGISSDGDAMTIQRQVVLDYLLKGNVITQMDAINKFGFTRLSAIIFQIKAHMDVESKGFVIKDKRVNGVNRFGNKCNYKEYWIEQIN